MPSIFPFTAIVGQDKMKLALVLNAINTQIGGVLVRGERGTAKSTAARALAELLPLMDVVEGCHFGCNPKRPDTFCDDCMARMRRGEELKSIKRKVSMVDLPVSATEDRVVGTLDIEKAIKRGEKHFDPGVMAAANRGILYVDEVNLLDDHVVDLLLDAAAMGVNFVEREGISFSHPAQFVLVGTMNPEEGELRPQLLDRFGLCVEIHGISDPTQRTQILSRRIEFERDPSIFIESWHAKEHEQSELIARARDLVSSVRYTENDLYQIAELTSQMEVDGHRADIVILKTATAHAALSGRDKIRSIDILAAAELALPHRLKRRPFQDTELQFQQLERKLEQARAEAAEDEARQSEDKGEAQASQEKKTTPKPATRR
ncbi:MAG: ATP-binding protein [Chloroflexi bacterium]|nr:ATP-binding protein [Chloroflexota bacterium]